MREILIMSILLVPPMIGTVPIYGGTSPTTKEFNMKEYEVELTTKDNRRITDTVRATSSFDAKKIIRDRYPNCVIWNVRQMH